MPSLSVACAQLRGTVDPEGNLRACADLVRRAADQGARLVVLPEAAMASFAARPTDVAQPLDGPFADGLRALARETRTWVVAGMFTPADDGRVHNTLLATDGSTDAVYHKRHLFDAFNARESKRVAPGQENVTVDVDGITVGLATCYDVRFAHQFTELGLAGAQVICLPASWADGERKAEQWQLLCRSRAMDAQAYLVAADQAWQPSAGPALGIGRSLVAGPLGEVVAELGPDPDVLVTTLDLDVVARVRQLVPVLAAQRA